MSLGVRNVDDGDIDKMMAEAPGALNFTTFLNMLAEKLHGTDSEDVILEGNFFTRKISRIGTEFWNFEGTKVGKLAEIRNFYQFWNCWTLTRPRNFCRTNPTYSFAIIS